ncbi:MAG: hypothetical protein ACRBC3_19780 [Burkholderiaceae bacterium]
MENKTQPKTKFQETVTLGDIHPRRVFAENLKKLAERYECATQTLFVALAKEQGVTVSGSMYSRAINQKGAPDLDFVAKVSLIFDIEPWRLLAPNLNMPSFWDFSVSTLRAKAVVSDEMVETRMPATKAMRLSGDARKAGRGKSTVKKSSRNTSK